MQLSSLLRLRSIALGLGLLAVAPLPMPHLHPVHAEDAPASPGRSQETEKGFSLMEEGAKLLLRGLMSEMEPSIADIEGALRDIAPEMEAHMAALGPQLRELSRMMRDVTSYDLPVMLENGDILIRRKEPLPPGASPAEPDQQPHKDMPVPRRWPSMPGPNGEIDL